MKLGFVSDSLGNQSLVEMLDNAQRLGVGGVEINTGGWSTAPHFDLQAMLSSSSARNGFSQQMASRDLEIASFNANGNPLHPTDKKQAECLKDTIRLAGEMGVKKVCTMSGLPAGSLGDVMSNWVVASWPPETKIMLDYQWNDVLFPFWQEIVALAKDSGVEQIALELHGNQCVYNVPTLFRLRDEVGPIVGANLDPSHIFWMGGDPLAMADALDDALQHVHAKNTMMNKPIQATTTSLENGDLTNIAARSWTYITLGYGHDEQWWRQFAYRLLMIGYDDYLSIEHEDILLNSLEGLEKSVALLNNVMPKLDADLA